ncbi:MAG: efflux RND transporter periplasmic adaptor subunit [Thiotrichaceae bacterium]
MIRINKKNTSLMVFILLGLVLLSSVLLAEKHVAEDNHHKDHNEASTHEDDHDKEEHKNKHEEHSQDEHHKEVTDHSDGEETHNDVELTKEQIHHAGIQTMKLKKQAISHTISALSEVKLNQYQTIQVSPTITTRVEKRHVYLGDVVKKGDLLVTLHTITTTDISSNMLATADLAASSAELAASIAEAKGELAAATATWNRIRALGQDAVSGKRYTATKIAYQQAQAKLQAYGQSQKQVNRLFKSGSKAVQKHFELRAEQDGTIINDDFVLGQVVNPDDVLFEISDISKLWVEANIKPNDVARIKNGAVARIQSGDAKLQGKVIHIGRILNESTRTLSIRIEVTNKDKTLYPGQFVKTHIDSQTTHDAMTVPAEAVLRGSDGDWMVFIEEAPGIFEPNEVDILEDLGNTLVINGLETGMTIVSKGAFTLQSELAKSGFSVHNH